MLYDSGTFAGSAERELFLGKTGLLMNALLTVYIYIYIYYDQHGVISDRGYRNFRKARRRHTSMPVQVLLITEDKKFRANSFCSYEEYAPLQFTSGTFEDADCSIGIPPSSPSVSANSRSTSEMTWNHPQGATHTTKLYRERWRIRGILLNGRRRDCWWKRSQLRSILRWRDSIGEGTEPLTPLLHTVSSRKG